MYINARGTDTVLYDETEAFDHTAGSVTTAPVVTVPCSAQGFSIMCGGDDFLDNPGVLSATAGGTGWSEIANVMSGSTGGDRAGIVVSVGTGTGTLATATATFNRSVKGHCSDSFYLKA